MKKNFVKTGLVLLIAAFFLLPAGVIGVGMASNDEVGNYPDPDSGGKDIAIVSGGDNQGPNNFGDNFRDLSTPSLNWVANTDSGVKGNGQSYSANGHNWGATFTDPSDMKVYTNSNGISFGLNPPAWAWTSTVDGDTLTYHNTQNNVDVEYKISEGNIKETIVLNQATPRNWVFKYTMQDLAGWELVGNHHIRMWKIENDLTTEYIIPKGNAWDSAGNTSDVMYECEQDPDNPDAFTVELVLNNSFINGATYPISIDPTINIYSQIFLTFKKSAFSDLSILQRQSPATTLDDYTILDSNCKPIIAHEGYFNGFNKTEISYTAPGVSITHLAEATDYFHYVAMGINASGITENFTLMGVSLCVEPSSVNLDGIQIWIAKDNDGLPDNTTEGRISEIVIQDWDDTLNYVWNSAFFNTPVNITIGSRYWIMLHALNSSSTQYYRIQTNTSNSYPDGYSAWDDGTGWAFGNVSYWGINDYAYDVNFQIITINNSFKFGHRAMYTESYGSGRTLLDIETHMLPKSEKILIAAHKPLGTGTLDRSLWYISLYDNDGSLLNNYEYVLEGSTVQGWETANRINVSTPTSTADFTVYTLDIKSDLTTLGLLWDTIGYVKLRNFQYASANSVTSYLYNLISLGDYKDTLLSTIAPADRLLIQDQSDYVGFYLTPLENNISYYHVLFENVTVENLSVNDVLYEKTDGVYNITGMPVLTQALEIRIAPQTLVGDLRFDIKIEAYRANDTLIGTEHFRYPSVNIQPIKIKSADDYIQSSMKGQKHFGNVIELYNKNNMSMNATYTYVLKYQGVQIWSNTTNLTNDNATTREVRKYAALCREGSYTLDTTISFVEYGKNRTYTLTDTIGLGKQADVSKTDLASTLWGVKGNSLLTFTAMVNNNNTLYSDYSENATYYIVINNNGIKTVTTWTDLSEGLNQKTLTLNTPATNYTSGFVDVKIYRKLYTSAENNLALVYPSSSVLNLTSLHGIHGSDVFGVLLSSQNTTIHEGSEPLTTTTGWSSSFTGWMIDYYWYVVGGIVAAAMIAILYVASKGKPRKRGRH